MFRLNMGPEGVIDDFTVIISFRDHHWQGKLTSVHNFTLDTRLESRDECSFTVYKYLDKKRGIIEPLWDQICDFKLIYIPEIDEYFEIQVTEVEDETFCKNVVGYGAGEAELSQTKLNALEINTEGDILRDEYVEPTVFYDPDKPYRSFLHRAFDKVPQWGFGHVDASLWNIQRTFQANGEYLYDFLVGEVAEEIGCLFVFDSVHRLVNVYDFKSTCKECGYREWFNHVCPKCGSAYLESFGEDTCIYIDAENFGQEFKFTTDQAAVKNCFYLKSGDDNFDAAIRDRNPNGTQYIYYFSDDFRHDMPMPLLKKMDEYAELYQSYLDEYEQLTKDYRYWLNQEWYLKHSMMPTPEIVKYTAKDVADRLSSAKMSPIGFLELDDRTSKAEIERVINNYAKVGCHTKEINDHKKLNYNSGQFRTKCNTISWTVNSEGQDQYTKRNLYSGVWTGTITVTNRNEMTVDTDGREWLTDETTTGILTIDVLQDYELYINQRTEEIAWEQEKMDTYGCIFDILMIRDEESMAEAVKVYSLYRLIAIRDSFQACIDVMHGTVHDIERAELYDTLYVKYNALLNVIKAEIEIREKQVEEANAKWMEIQQKRLNIQKTLNFPNFLGEELWKVFCMYIREDTYNNPNYVSDGFNGEHGFLDDPEILEDVENYYQSANEQLVKSGEWQHSITGKLFDFLALPQFRPFKDKIELGNWINVRIDDRIYRLRLVEIGIEFDHPEQITVGFSTVGKIRNSWNDTRDILSKAVKMGQSYGATAQKADWAKDKAEYVNSWLNRGLNLSETTILDSADHQQMQMNHLGLWLKRWDDRKQGYEDEQIRIIGNGLYYTKDNWESINAGIGHFYYSDPRSDTLEHGYGLIAETIVGQVVLSEEVGVWTPKGEIILDAHGYRQIIEEKNYQDSLDNTSDERANYKTESLYDTFFQIQKKETDGSTYDIINISEEKMAINLPKGDFRVDSGNIDFNGSNIYLTSSAMMKLESATLQAKSTHLVLESSDFTLANKSKLDIQSGEINIGSGGNINLTTGSSLTLDAGVHLDLKGSEIWATAGTHMRFDANAVVTIQGARVDLSGSEINLNGVTSVNNAVLITNEGFLVATDATFNDVKLNNMTSTGSINLSDDYSTFKMTGSEISIGDVDTGNGFYINSRGEAYFATSCNVGATETSYWGATYPTMTLSTGTFSIEEGNIDAQQGDVISGNDFITRNEVENNSYVSTYALQNAAKIYSDQGFGTIAEDGICYIEIDPTMDVLVDGLPYVFVQSYGKDQVWVSEVDDVHFVVHGEPNTDFAWFMLSTKAGHEHHRLDFMPIETEIVEDLNNDIEDVLFDELLLLQQELNESPIYNPTEADFYDEDESEKS